MFYTLAKSYELHNNQCYVDGVLQSTTSACNGPLSILIGIILIPLIIIWLLFLVFWVMMLIHAIKHENLENRDAFLALLIAGFFFGFGWIAAIIYYFAAKRPYDRKQREALAQPTMPPQATPSSGTPSINNIGPQS